MDPTNPFDALDDSPGPTAAPAPAPAPVSSNPVPPQGNPFDDLDEPDPTHQTAKTLNGALAQTGGDEMPTITVTGTREKPASWSDVGSAILPTVGSTIESRLSGVQEKIGNVTYDNARKKLWQSIVLPDAVRRAKEQGISLTDDDQVRNIADHLGIRVDTFTRDWPSYVNQSAEERQQFQAEQRERIASGAANKTEGAQRRAMAAQVAAGVAPNTAGSPIKSVAFNIATMAPDLLVGYGGSVATGGLGGVALMAANIAPGEYAQARNQGLNDRDASTYSLLSTVASSVPEVPVMKVVSGSPAGRRVLQTAVGEKLAGSLAGKVAGTAITQGVTQSFVAALQEGIDKGLVNNDDTLSEALGKIAESGVVGAVVGAPMGAVHHLGSREAPAAEQPPKPRLEPTISDELPPFTAENTGVVTDKADLGAAATEPGKSGTQSPAEATPTEEKPPADTEVHAALKAMERKDPTPPQVELLEDQGLAKRNEVGEPRLLPAGRRKLTEFNANPPSEVEGEKEAAPQGEKGSTPETPPNTAENTGGVTDETPGGVNRFTDDHDLRAALSQMKDETGWYEKGGQLIRNPTTDEVTSRTSWIPNSEWWPGRPKGLTESQVHDAVDKALSGQPLSKPEQSMVEYMRDVHDARMQTEAYLPKTSELPDREAVPVGDAYEAGMVTRLADIDPEGFESLAKQHEDSDAPTFLRAVKERLDEHDGQAAGADSTQGAGAPAQEAQEEVTPETFAAQLEKARSETNVNPTDAQKMAGNYAKGTLRFGGMDVALENPKGSVRKGVGSQGESWQRHMVGDYGYVKGTHGSDGDAVDVFMTGKPDTGHVYVINQMHPDTGNFDEHKAILGAESRREATKLYRDHYPRDWKGMGTMVEMSTEAFKHWVNSSRARKQVRDRDIPVERRKDLARRAKVSQMTPEQLRRELLSHELTHIPNRRAYEESEKLPAQVSVDVDSLKWINDNMGHGSGDELLKAVAASLSSHTDNAYHLSGDEFAIQAHSEEEAREIMQQVNDHLRHATIEMEGPDGKVIEVKGLGVSFGTAKTLHEADEALKAHKAEREAQGLRAPRGEAPPGTSVRAGGEGLQDQADHPASQKRVIERDQPIRATQDKITQTHNQVASLVRDLGLHTGSLPTIEVHKDASTLPQHILGKIKADKAEALTSAVYDPQSNHVHVIAANNASETELRENVIHELVGHHGLRMAMDRSEYNQVMDGIARDMPERVEAAAQRNGLDLDNLEQRRVAAEEVIAYAAGRKLSGQEIDPPVVPYYKRVLKAIPKFLGKLVGKRGYDEKTIDQLIQRSLAALRSGEPGSMPGAPLKSQRAPRYYSAVERAVLGSKQEKASADQWMGMLKNAAGVKPEEMEWLGLEKWLREHKGAIPKAEVAEYLKAHALQLEETDFGNAGGQSAAERNRIHLAENLRAQGHGVDFNEDKTLDSVRLKKPDGGYSEYHLHDRQEMDDLKADTAAWGRPELFDQVSSLELAANAAAFEEHLGGDGKPTAYDDYTLPGGFDYTERLIRLPTATDAYMAAPSQGARDALTYRSSHWQQEPNVLAHVRYKTRTDPEGKKVLHLEELQSDWHQAGRKHGYFTEADRDALRQRNIEALKRVGIADREMLRTRRADFDGTPEEVEAARQEAVAAHADQQAIERQLIGSHSGVPDAPFKTSWPMLIMKRMIRHAAETGHDRIAWTTGEQNAERYGLENRSGGEGMRGFYDDILPRETSKLIKKYGGKVSHEPGRAAVRTETPGRLPPSIGERGVTAFTQWHEELSRESGNSMPEHWGYDLTPEMKEAALTQGFPLFARRQGQLALTPPPPKGNIDRIRRAFDALYESKASRDVRKLFHPVGLSQEARAAARTAIQYLGKQAHDSVESQEALEHFSRAIDKLPIKDQLEMMDNIERGQPQRIAELQPVADKMRAMLDDWRDKVRGLGKGYLDNFIQDYFPHYWADDDQEKASRLVANIQGRAPLRGPATFLKLRTIPTIKEGIALGLKPLSTNPLILTLLKTREMQRFVTGVTLMQRFKDVGLAKFLPATHQMPEGWAPINDNIAKVRSWSEAENGWIDRGQYIMPEDAARVINNHVSRSALRDFAPIQGFRVLGNMLNAMQLGFSAFHLGFTTLDAIISKTAVGVERLFHGEPSRAAAAFGEALTGPGAAVMNVKRGYDLLKAYTNPVGATPEMATLVKALEAGGGRAHMDKYYQLAQGVSPFRGVGVRSLVNDIRQAMTMPTDRLEHVAKAIGSFPVEYSTKLLREMQALGKTHTALGIPFEVAGRVVRASTSWIMEHLVPMQKLGVFSDLAQDHIRRNPKENPDDRAEAMQKIWASVDNRLGEMVYDNLFWNRTFKDTLHLMVRAVGWNTGTIREIGGAPIDLAKALGRAMESKTYNPQDFGHKIPYVLAMTATTALYGAIANYLLTGEGPQELKDYFFPRTGGTTNYGTPQRVSLPSYVKDVYEYASHPGTTVLNKANPIFNVIGEMWRNEDFFGNPITDPAESRRDQLKHRAQFLASEFTPFSLQGRQQLQGSEKPGLGGAVRKTLPAIGITPAPGYITSPEEIEHRQLYETEKKYVSDMTYKYKKALENKDKAAADGYLERLIAAKKHLAEMEKERGPDKAKAAVARRKNATALRQQGLPATAALVASLPLAPDQEARDFFTRTAARGAG